MIRSQAALDIGHSLAVNKSLRFIDLSFNKLGREGGLALGQALLTNTTLETLNLSYTGLEAQVRMSMISHHHTIQRTHHNNTH